MSEGLILSSSGHCVFSLWKNILKPWAAAELEEIMDVCVFSVGTLKSLVRQGEEDIPGF